VAEASSSSSRERSSEGRPGTRQTAGKKSSSKRTDSSSSRKATPAAVASAAVRQLAALTGRDAEGVTSLAKSDGGWQVELEVVESHRIPDTTDLMALYEVQVDADGGLISYRRLRRYSRGHAGGEQGPG